MKKNLSLLFLISVIIAFAPAASAQNKKMNLANFEKKKMEYIQKQAELTEEEAGRYFPIYNEFSKKKFNLHREYRRKIEKMNNNQKISDFEYRKLINNDVDLKLKEAELEKEYAEKFEKALAPEKLYKAQQAEKKFLQNEVMKFRANE